MGCRHDVSLPLTYFYAIEEGREVLQQQDVALCVECWEHAGPHALHPRTYVIQSRLVSSCRM